MKKLLFLFVLSVSVSAAAAAENSSDSPQVSVNADNLMLPLSAMAEYSEVSISDPISGKTAAKFDALVPDSKLKPAAAGGGANPAYPQNGEDTWRAPFDISAYKGGAVDVKIAPASVNPQKFAQLNSLPSRDFSADRGRPAFHFTTKYGRLDSPAGLLFYKNRWHLFALYNPFALNPRPDKYLAHAESGDLLRWQHRPDALKPTFGADGAPEEIVAVSAFADERNASGLFPDGCAVFAVSVAGRGDYIYTARGDLSKLEKFSETPAIGGDTGGAKIFFNPESEMWTIVRSEKSGGGWHFSVYVSKDLKKWEKTQDFAEGFSGRPEFAKLPVSGRDESKWVVMDGVGKYFTGSFDGRTFTPDTLFPLRVFYGAAKNPQFWSGAPDGRVLASVLVEQPDALMRTLGQTFSQSVSLPWQLGLVRLRDGSYQLRASVAREVSERITERGEDAVGVPGMTFSENVYDLPDAVGNTYVLAGAFDVSACGIFRLEIGTSIFTIFPNDGRYNVSRLRGDGRTYDAQFSEKMGVLELAVFVDKYGAEMIINSGEAVLFAGDALLNPDQPVKVGSKGQLVIANFSKFGIYKNSAAERRESRDKILQKLVEKPE